MKHMQGVCRLSLRWHQQFCHSANFSAHSRCVQALKPARGYRQSTRHRPPQYALPKVQSSEPVNPYAPSEPFMPDIVVREYEQDVKDKTSLRRVEPNQEFSIELKEVRAQMEKLEQELAVMKQGPFGPESEFMQSLPAVDREQLLKALAQETTLLSGEEDMLTIAELDRLAEADENNEQDALQKDVRVSIRIPKKDQAYVRHFNKALKGANESEGEIQGSLVLWTWYLRCQQQVPKFSNIIPHDVWTILWQSQANLKVRPKHLVMLAQDMLAAGEPLEDEKWFAYIEALSKTGDVAAAIELWQKLRVGDSFTARGHMSFLDLGVKLFAQIGRPLKAQELALNAIKCGQAQPRILIPVIIAWAKTQGPDALTRSWACYLRLRGFMGSEIQPEIFQEVSNALLDAECADLALSVFKDMLLMKEQSPHDSRAVYRQATKHIEKVLQSATTEDQINHIGLSALLVLPRIFQNRFFFTSWIKKLIGEGRIDSAAMVVELMYERGIVPDAKPLNGIIGAWLRDGSSASQRKAEVMANGMIAARLDFIDKARQVPTASDTIRQALPPREFGHARRAVFLRRRLPPATIETFSILLLHYTRRSEFEKAEQLTTRMTGPCQIKPNSFILNHWLYADLRASQIQDVWTKFKNLTPEITPDLETFTVLWDASKAHYSRGNTVHTTKFPSARELFADMLKWSNNLTPSKVLRVRQEFPAALYDQIIRCFCLSGDLPGTLVAIYGLSKVFGIYPTENAIRLICGSAARLLPGDQRGRVRKSKPRLRSVLAQVADIIETIETRKKVDLLEAGIDGTTLEDPQSDVAKDLRLSVMVEFICMFLQQTQNLTGSYKNDVKIASKTMGLDMDGVNLDVSTDVS